MFRHFKNDLNAGLVVFLIALPLSVGISVASGAPPASGLITASIGGTLGAILGSGSVNINGPAAGLIVIVYSAIESVGFEAALACFVIAGGIQVLLGFGKLANWVKRFPESVIHGMLMAIGVIVTLKQFPIVIGTSFVSKNPLAVLTSMKSVLAGANPEIAMIGITCLLTLITLDRVKIRYLSKIPTPLIVTLIGILFSLYLELEQNHHVHTLLGGISFDFDVGPKYLLKIPDQIKAVITFPNFSRIFEFNSLKIIFSVALVASLESLLSSVAVDRLDPEKRTTDLNRELYSKGFCNIASSMIGGLPMITEIVRSSANISNGAKSKLANFFHGLFILLFVLLFPHCLSKIPLATLASILLVVGFRLGHPKHLVHAYKEGFRYFLVFLSVFIITVAKDLLLGIIIGTIIDFSLHFALKEKKSSLEKKL